MANAKGRTKFAEGDLVRHVESGELGHVVADVWDVCAEDEVAVEYAGRSGYIGTDPRVLEKVPLN